MKRLRKKKLKTKVSYEQLLNGRRELKLNRINFEKRANAADRIVKMNKNLLEIKRIPDKDTTDYPYSTFYYYVKDERGTHIVQLIDAKTVRIKYDKEQLEKHSKYVPREVKVMDIVDFIDNVIDANAKPNNKVWQLMYLADFMSTYHRFRDSDFNAFIAEQNRFPGDELEFNVNLNNLLTMSRVLRTLANLYAVTYDTSSIIRDELSSNDTYGQYVGMIRKIKKIVENTKDDKSLLNYVITGDENKDFVKEPSEAMEMIKYAYKYGGSKINFATLTDDVISILNREYNKQILDFINSQNSNILFDEGKVNPNYVPMPLPFEAENQDLNKAYSMFNELASTMPFRKDGIINDYANKLVDGRLFMDIEDIPDTPEHGWDDSKYFLAQLISIFSLVQSKATGEDRKAFAQKLLNSFVITNNTASSHGYSYHFYFPIRVIFRDLNLFLNTSLVHYLRNEYKKENVFKYLDPLVYLDEFVNLRLMYFNKAGSLFAPRKGTRSQTSMKYSSDVDRLVIGDEGKIDERIEQYYAKRHDLTLGVHDEFIRAAVTNFDRLYPEIDPRHSEVVYKMIKRAVTEPTYNVLCNACGLLVPGQTLIVASKGKSYHSFYKVGEWMIRNSNNDLMKLVQQTSINNLLDVTNKKLDSFLNDPIRPGTLDSKTVKEYYKDLNNESKRDELIKEHILPFIKTEGGWNGPFEKDSFNDFIREELDKLYS